MNTQEIFTFILKNKYNKDEDIKNTCFFLKCFYKKGINLLKLYEEKILNNTKVSEERRLKLEEMFIFVKKTINNLNTFVKKIKYDKLTVYPIDTDLYLNPLDEIGEDKRIKIVENKTIFHFRLSDLISSMYESITHNEGLFSEPCELRNPFTNIEIRKHNLYNIYFKMLETSYIIPPLITEYFMLGFDIDEFAVKNSCKLKDLTIQKYYLDLTTGEKFEECLNMFYEYKNYINGYTIRSNISFYRKRLVVLRLNQFIYNYILSSYTYNPDLKRKIMARNKSNLLEYITRVPSLNITENILIQYSLRRPDTDDRYTTMIEGTSLPTRTRLRRRNAINPMSPINGNSLSNQLNDNELTDVNISDGDSNDDVVMTDIENQGNPENNLVETIYFDQINMPPPPPVQQMERTETNPPPVRPPPPPPPLNIPTQPNLPSQPIRNISNNNSLPTLRMPNVRNSVNMNFNVRNNRLNIRPRPRTRQPNLMFASNSSNSNISQSNSISQPSLQSNNTNTITNTTDYVDTNISNIIRNINTTTSNIIHQTNMSQIRRNTYQNHNLFDNENNS